MSLQNNFYTLTYEYGMTMFPNNKRKKHSNIQQKITIYCIKHLIIIRDIVKYDCEIISNCNNV